MIVSTIKKNETILATVCHSPKADFAYVCLFVDCKRSFATHLSRSPKHHIVCEHSFMIASTSDISEIYNDIMEAVDFFEYYDSRKQK